MAGFLIMRWIPVCTKTWFVPVNVAAICDPVGRSKMTKKLVKRGVCRTSYSELLSINDNILNYKNNFLAAVHFWQISLLNVVPFLISPAGEF